MALENVVIRSAVQGLPDGFIARRAGHENEGRFRAAIARLGERGESVKTGDAVVGKDDIRRVMLEFVEESVA